MLASGRDVNVLVLDTEVYSNTGGQASKATPRGGGGQVRRRRQAEPQEGPGHDRRLYGNVYVGQIAMGANPAQTIKAFLEAEVLSRPVADPGLQPLHRPRHRHDHGDDPSEGRGGLRLLAAVPLRSAATTAQAVPLDSTQAEGGVQGIRRRSRPASPCWPGRNPEDAERCSGLGTAGHRRPVELLRTTGGVDRDGGEKGRLARTKETIVSVDLTTTYLGLKLKNPLVASASPLTPSSIDTLQKLEEAGAAAAVLPSLFEEQIEHEEMELGRL